MLCLPVPATLSPSWDNASLYFPETNSKMPTPWMCPDTQVMKEVPHAHGEHFVCSDTALIEQENLFPKTNDAVKIFKLTFLLLGNRDSL